MNLGQTIKQIRKRRKISQKQFAKNIGISVTALGNIENSGDVVPRKETFNKIATSLNVSKEYILFRSIKSSDIPQEKRQLFEALSPVLTKIFELEDELD